MTILFAPSAEALCDALVVNGRRLSAIMRPPAAAGGPVTAMGRQGVSALCSVPLAR